MYIYAETAFHHEGDKGYLFKLIDAAKESGVHGIKFQVLIDLNEFMSSKHSAYCEVKKWTLTLKEWEEIFGYTKKLGLDIILMPLDIKAFELVEKFDIRFIEIHSVSFRDECLLNKLNECRTSLIFGIGGRTIKEIDAIIKKYIDRDITLMVGFQSYPSDLRDVKLERIRELKKLYSNCQIGYADHSSYKDSMAISSNEYAYILGARVFEKHITIEEGKERVDYQSAVSIKKISTIVKKLNNLKLILNIESHNLFKMTEREVTYRNRQKVPVAKQLIKPGDVILRDLIELKMTDQENCYDSVERVIGKKTLRNIKKDCVFSSENLI